MMLVIIIQKFMDGSVVETGVPITRTNVLRWIYEIRNPNEIYLTIDIGQARSVKLKGVEATQTRDFIQSGFERIHTVERVE